MTGEENTCVPQKWDILQVQFNLIDYDRTLEAILQWRKSNQRNYVTITNPHSVMMCLRDHEMRRATAQAGLTLPDGAGAILAANILGYPHHKRVTGPTLMLKLCDWGRQHGLRHFFYGGSEGVADLLAQRFGDKLPGLEIAGTYCPPFRPLTDEEDETIVKAINATKPDVVWVGLGAPKQEKWMSEHLGKIKATAMIGVGAAFDFHSGNVKWAPGWVRKLGIEWAYRLAQNPRRMWRRNLSSPIFLTIVLCQRLRMMFDGGPT